MGPQSQTRGGARAHLKIRLRVGTLGRLSKHKKPRRLGGVLFAKESYYLVVMNTPGPMVELKETLFT